MGGIVQGHMFPTNIRLTGTELTFMSLPELSGAHLDAIGVLTNPTDHLSGCEPGFSTMSAHRLGSQYSNRVTHPELISCRFRGGLGSDGMLLLELIANVSRRDLLPREEVLGIHCHAFT